MKSIIFIIFILLSVPVLDFQNVNAQSNTQPTFSASTPITLSPVTTTGPYNLVVSGNNVYTLWSDESSGNWQVYFSKSTDGGNTFSSPVNLSKDTNAEYPYLAASENNVYVAWTDYSSSANGQIFFSASTDEGNTFNSPTNLNNDVGPTSYPFIYATGKNVYLSWYDNSKSDSNSNGNSQVFFRKSSDEGNSWSIIINLIPSSENADKQYYFATSGSNLYYFTTHHVPYGTTYVYVKASNNDGDSFSSGYEINTNIGNLFINSVYASSNNVYVASTNGGNIFLAQSTNSGTSFGNFVKVSSDNNADLSPVLGGSGTNVYLMWLDGKNSSYKVDYEKISNDGTSVGPIVELYNGDAINPHLAVYGDLVYAVWQDGTPGNNNPFMAASIDSGNTFGNVIKLNNISNPSGIVVDANSNLYLEWLNASTHGNTIGISTVSSPQIPPSASASQTSLNTTQQLGASTPLATQHKIPSWVKNIFILYGQGQISDDELLQAIQFLVQTGIMQLKSVNP